MINSIFSYYLCGIILMRIIVPNILLLLLIHKSTFSAAMTSFNSIFFQFRLYLKYKKRVISDPFLNLIVFLTEFTIQFR